MPLDLLFLASPRLPPTISQWVHIILLNADAQAFARAGLCVLLPFGLPTCLLPPARVPFLAWAFPQSDSITPAP